MNTPDIGSQILFEHRGQQITGRVVGREPSEYRYRFPRTGLVLTVDVGGGEWLQIHDSAVVRQEQPA